MSNRVFHTVLTPLRELSRRNPRIRQVVQSLGAVGIVQLSLVVSGIVTARRLGPAGRGDVAVILALPSVVMNLVCVGFPSAVTYFVARRRDVWGTIVRRVIGAALGQLILGLMILFALDVYFLANKASAVYTAGLLVLLSLPLMMLQYYVSHIVQGLGDIKWVNVLRVSGPGLYSCGVLAVSFVGLTVIRCSLIWIVSQLVAAAVAAVHLVHRERRSVRRSNRHGTRALPTARSIARFAIAGFLAQISPIESFRLDTLVVAALFPSRIVGYYSVANSVTNLPLFSADALSAVAYPHVAEQDGSDAVNASRHYMKLGALIAGALAAVSALAIPFAIPLLFGHAYSPAIGTAELLACAAVVLGLRRLGNDLLRGLGRPSLSTRLEMITLVVFAASLLVFGPVGAGRGVAVSLIVAAGLGIVLFGRSLRRTEEEGRVQRLVPEQTD